MKSKILKIALLTLLVSLVVVSTASAHTGEQHIELSDPEQGEDPVKEPDTPAKPDEKESSEKAAPAPSEPEHGEEKKEETDDDETEIHDPGASYKLIAPSQPGYLFGTAIVLVVVALFVMSVFFLK